MTHYGFLEDFIIRDIRLQLCCVFFFFFSKTTRKLKTPSKAGKYSKERQSSRILRQCNMYFRVSFSTSCCDIINCFVNLVAYTEMIRAKKVKQQVSRLWHQSFGKASFQLKISMIFWTKSRILCEENLKTLFSPLLLGVYCSVKNFYTRSSPWYL